MFWSFVLRLTVGSCIALIVFGFMLMPLLGLAALTMRRGDSKLSPLGYPVLALSVASQFYFWGMWAAYCASLAVFRASHPDVTHAWLYYVVAFLFGQTPLSYLASKELVSAGSRREVERIKNGLVLYSSFAIAAFLVFSLRPGLMAVPYGWFVGFAVPMEGRAARALEEKYLATLDTWVTRGGRVEDVQGTVVKACGKLVMLNATPGERVRLATIDREDLRFRVAVCTKMTVNRVHPQPEFQKREMVSMVCDPGGLALFLKLCARSGLR